MSDIFPYGNNLDKPNSWVGYRNTKSSTWLVSYVNSFAIGCGYHSFIFFGLESLSIGVVTLNGCGPVVEAPIGRLGQGIAGMGKTVARRIEEFLGDVGKVKSIGDHVKYTQSIDEISNGMALYNKMKEGIPTLRESLPMSFEDLAGMPGSVAGAQVEVVGAAGMYFLEGFANSRDMLRSQHIFGPWTVANAGTGLVAAGVGGLIGVWSVGKCFNLYFEIGDAAREQCQLENSSPTYAQPYMQFGNLHQYLRELPPSGCELTPDVFRPQIPWQRTLR